ncbi:sensor histidine kinase [Arthrobacter sp. ISL-5]|uniref:sensor histidine kinase n=1 Tax=Arthrobacter sp. ISL-5 TaxID=2819111 RepID=UPI001BE947C6|nr:ATP-binding protein [Arthrobacter sp. ISL-5]MBT2553506.1 ATP-binding protein [Arthrobacter sp. ISL-5]
MTTAATLEAVTDVGGVITDPQPVDFHRLGLAGCIDRLTAPLRRQGMCVHWETPHHGLEISSSCASLLYRTAQEALSNTFKRGDATDVTVRLAAVFHGIRLTVADNGTGFEGTGPAAVPSAHKPACSGGQSAGLRTMSVAVQDAGGTVAIDSAPGTGTAVTVTIPLD